MSRFRAPDWIAFGFGSGFAPFAPGTFGSLVGVGLFMLSARYGGVYAPWILTLIATVVGFLTAGGAAQRLAAKDPGPVVIDEIAGQCIALLALPGGWRVALAGFIAFRIFDIAKIPPARQLESLPGATGIMCDDLIAGVYANLTVRILLLAIPALGN